MQLLVISDIHGEGHRLNQLIDGNTPYDAIVFLGDGWRDVEYLRDAYPQLFVGVKGNCDYDCDWHTEYCFSMGGVTFFMAHGHTYGVKRSLDSLAAAAHANGAQVALYGHTHRADTRYVDGVLCINPGHVCYPNSTATYCVVQIDNGEVCAKITKLG